MSGPFSSFTFNVNNLPAHMSYYVVFGPNVFGDSTDADTFTLTGPHGIDIVATPTTMNLLDVAVPDDGADTDATFTLAAHLGGTGRFWTIGK